MALHLSSIIIHTSAIIYLYITLHLSPISRRHYRMRPVFVRSLTTEDIIIEIMIRTFYKYQYDEENK